MSDNRTNEQHLLYVKTVLIDYLKKADPIHVKLFEAFVNVCEGKKPDSVYKDAYHVKECMEELVIELEEAGLRGSALDAKMCIPLLNMVVNAGTVFKVGA